MARDRSVKINSKHFSGNSQTYADTPGGLSPTMVGLLQELARERVKRLNILDLINNVAGTRGISATFDATGGAFEDMVTITAHGAATGDGPYQLIGGTVPTGLAAATDYFLIVKNANVFQLATSKANALSGTVETFSSDGSSIELDAIDARVSKADLTAANLTGLTTGITSASLNTAADTVTAGYAVLATRVNELRTPLSMGAMDVGPGTVAAAGTVPVVDDSASNNSGNTDSATHVSGQAVLQDLLDAERTLIAGVNEVCAAVGVTKLTFLSSHNGSIEVGLDINQGAAIDNAADGADATSTFLLTEWDAALDSLSDNMETIVAKVDDLTDNVAEVIHYVFFHYNLTDLSAGTDITLTSPVNGRIRGITTMVTDATVATGNNVIDVENPSGTAVTGGQVTVANSSPIGTMDTDAIADTATNIVKKGAPITLDSDGGSTDAGLIGWLHIVETDESAIASVNYAG